MASYPAEEGAFLLVNLYAADLTMRSASLYKSCLLSMGFDDLRFQNQAVHYAREAVKLMPLLQRNRYPTLQYNLARSLLRRCEMARMGLAWLRQFNADFHSNLDAMEETKLFRGALRSEAKSVKRNEDLLEAIQRFQNALELLTDDNELRSKCRDYLWLCYAELDGKIGGFHKIDFEVDEKFHYLWTWMHEDRDKSQLCDPVSLDVMSLDSKIKAFREALTFFSRTSDSVKAGDMLLQLGWHLRSRFLAERKREDIEEALKCCCFDLKEVLPTSPWFVGTHLNIASSVCLTAFEQLGRQKDMDNAVAYAERALQVVDSQDARFLICLHHWAFAMYLRYRDAGDENDLDAALNTLMSAVRFAESSDVDLPGSGALHKLDDPKRFQVDLPQMLRNLETMLRERFHRSGRSEHLIQAIKAAEKASDLMPPKTRRRMKELATLSYYKVHLFKISRKSADLAQAFQHLEEAESIMSNLVDSGREVDSEVKLYLLNARFNYEEFVEQFFVGSEMSLATLDEIIGQARDLASRYNDLTFERSRGIESHSLLGRALFKRWEKTASVDYIDEAIRRARRMIEITRDLAGWFVKARKRLAEFLYDRFKRKGGDDDRKEALALLLEGFRTPVGIPLDRIEAGKLAVDILSEMAEWNSAHKLIGDILRLLGILNTRSLAWEDKQLLSSTFLTEAAKYASIALQAGSDVFDVIELLEAWRGSILGHLIDDRSDLDDLMRTKEGREKAERFRELRKAVNMIDLSEDMAANVEQANRRINAEGELRKCIEEIRTLEGFNRFLLGPTQKELQNAAARGPIIIVNVSSIRSDAIIISTDAPGPVLLPLPKLGYQEVKKYDEQDLTNCSDFGQTGRKNKEYKKFQVWLWDNCVKLIFEKLDDLAKSGNGEISANVPAKLHVWWIGIGVASFLPFHAAGNYTPGSFRETALSRAIASYIPSLKILISGRRRLKDDPTEPDVQHSTSKSETQQLKPQLKPRLAVIMMPSTPDKESLPGVTEESEKIQEIVRDTYLTKLLYHPDAQNTMELMAKCEVVHFACHGESSFPFAFNSHLLLQTTPTDDAMPVVDELRLSAVAAANLSHGKLAFLSACSTAQTRAPDLRDEALHLVSGFHIAGYLHAVGNLWVTDDAVSILLVEGFYKHLVAAGELGDGDHVAKALNEAVIGVAKSKQYARQPLCWAQLVHFGV